MEASEGMEASEDMEDLKPARDMYEKTELQPFNSKFIHSGEEEKSNKRYISQFSLNSINLFFALYF